MFIYGKHSITEALTKRSDLVEMVCLTKNKVNDTTIVSLLDKHKTPYQVVTEEEIEHKVGKDAVHQGLCALIKDKELCISLDGFFLQNKETNPCLILLDELEDPHNVGAIIRSSLAFGASGVLISSRGQAPITNTVVKTSVGAVFSIPLISIGNSNTTLRTLKDKGYWVYALTGDGDTSLYNTVFDTPTVFIIGSEGKGVREKTEEVADFRLSIPISKDCESLNASNAVAVTLYEWAKQNTR